MLSEALKVILKEVVVDPDKEAKWEALTMIARSPGVFRSRTEMEQAAPEAIAYVSKVLLENEPKWWTTLGKYAGIGLAVSGVAVVTSPIWLQAVGFTAAGIAALSLAASVMGPATVAGSFFAACQSVGAAGLGSTYLFTFISYLAGGGTIAGLGAGGIRVGWDFLRNANPQERGLLMAQHMWGQAIEKAFPSNQVIKA
jgi:hypothetical protein